MAAKVATMLALVLGLARAPPLLRRPGGRAELRLRGELVLQPVWLLWPGRRLLWHGVPVRAVLQQQR
jgi:hypothetical protein|uniref:Uncharacterized protein n=1 Tax=Oryza barthii TaxID=65489 RepID=A0A0D3FXF0_9ORYZ